MGRSAYVLVLVVLALGVGYVAWWARSPGDCAVLTPQPGVWRVDGLHPDLRGPCAGLVEGDVVVGSRAVPGGTEYVLAGGDRTVVEPSGPPRIGPALAAGWSIPLFTLALAVLAGYALVRRRGEPAVGALAVLAAGLLASSAATLVGLPAGASGWPRVLFLGLVVLVYQLAWDALVLFTLVFPAPVRRVPGRLVLLGPVLLLVGAALLVPGPYGSPGWVGGVIVVQTVLTVAAVAGSVVIAVRRFRSAGAAGDAVSRQQLRWVGAGGFSSAVLVLGLWMVPTLFGDPLLPSGWIGLPGLLSVAALAVALLRLRLFDLDRVANRTIVYTALTATVVLLYLSVTSALAILLGSGTAAVVGALVVALVVNPLRLRLQRAVNRLLYGERDDPYAVLRGLGTRVAATVRPSDVLPAAAADLARALRVPYVGVELPGEAPVAVGRDPGVGVHREPVVHRGEEIAVLRVAPRGPDEGLGRADLRLVADLARQLGPAVRVVRLDLDLRRSREALVLAREEERRRLRRVLHDELGPAVAALSLRAETARRLRGAARAPAAPGPDPSPADLADAELVALRRDASAAAAGLRRLAYDLRPPALDASGLVAALREGYPGLEVDVTGELPALPAAVEVAAYRIAREAIANAARHAGTARCAVELRLVDETLHLTVSDEGPGWPEPLRAGVGLTSIRERAAELDGEVLLDTTPAGGARLTVRLPVPTDGEASR
jgi:signal transduction histidine kinase